MLNSNSLVKSILVIFLFCSISLHGDALKLSMGVISFDYVETNDDGKFLNSETSEYDSSSSFGVSYRKDFDTVGINTYVKSLTVSINQTYVETKYDGFLQSSATGAIISEYQSTTQNEIFESNIRLMETTYKENFDVSLFISYGYREWLRDMTDSPYGYKEIYSWQYYDVGFTTTLYDGDWELGVEAVYQKAINPEMIAYLNGDMKFDLGTTKGYSYSIPLGYNVTKNLKLELEYKYDNWKIEKSNIVDGYHEPQSITENELISLSLEYKF